jgi:hypothetical protein
MALRSSTASLRSFSTTRTWQHRVQRIQGRRYAEQALDLDGRQSRSRLRLLRGLDGIPWEQWWSCLEEGYWLLGIYVLMAVYDVLTVDHCFTTVKMSFN